MDAKSTIIKPWPKQGLSDHVRAAPTPPGPRPSRTEAEAAVRTLIAYAGDDPDGYAPRGDVVRFIEAYAGFIQAPVRTSVPVRALCQVHNGFRLETGDGADDIRIGRFGGRHAGAPRFGTARPAHPGADVRLPLGGHEKFGHRFL